MGPHLSKSFKGRPVLPGNIEGEVLVSLGGFNAYASFYNSLYDDVKIARCSDSGNPDTFGKILSGKILCMPKTIGSTSAGAVWQRIAKLDVAPKALLFSQPIDSLAVGGIIVADKWAGKRIIAVDQLGDEFLASVKNGDLVIVYKDGNVLIKGDE